MKHPNRPSLADFSRPEPVVLLRFVFVFFLYAGNPALFAEDQSTGEKSTELESVRDRIEDVKSGLDAARSESELLQEELRQTELAASKQLLKLQGLEEQIGKRYERLQELNLLIAKHEKTLESERRSLAQQLHASYMSGRSDYLKLLLNQEDPANVGRVLAYYDYYNRARIDAIHSITEKVAMIEKLHGEIRSETELLERLKQRQFAKSEELNAYRESRNDILARLQEEIDSKGQQLKSLQEHERKLSALINKLDQREDRIGFFEDVPPFDTLKGTLQWPVKGKLLNTFGARRKGNSLKWQGVKIGANAGNEVQAVHTGKVIFADWFRNLGLLVILDHGGGYMSLYGYNQTLLKKPGDWVLAGEPIALVGDTGGQTLPGVYFEIRHRSKPLDPVLWCKR